MQIALTKKLADAMGIKPGTATEAVDPLFLWTANWTNTFERRKEDLLILVNSATRFVVTIYGVKRKQMKNVDTKIEAAIRRTLLSMNINPVIVDNYFRKAGKIQFVANHDRQAASHVTTQARDGSWIIGNAVKESQGRLKYEDTLGRLVSDRIVNISRKESEPFTPYDKMLEVLAARSSKPIYKYHAVELCVTLDLDIYRAVRRLIVPADITFSVLHHVLQNVFGWKNLHFYEFKILDELGKEPLVRFVTSEEDVEYDEISLFSYECRLSDYLRKDKPILYTYDMGDYWEHRIQLVRDIPEYHKESPYLLEATGQAPPEDVGGVGGFIDFLSIINDPSHPEYEQMREWAGYWAPEMYAWQSAPRVVRR